MAKEINTPIHNPPTMSLEMAERIWQSLHITRSNNYQILGIDEEQLYQMLTKRLICESVISTINKDADCDIYCETVKQQIFKQLDEHFFGKYK